MVNDLLEKDTFQQPQANSRDEFRDTAGDLEDLYNSFSDNAENTSSQSSDTNAQSTADTATKPNRIRGAAEDVGGGVGRSLAEEATGSLGADENTQEVAGNIGEYTGREAAKKGYDYLADRANSDKKSDKTNQPSEDLDSQEHPKDQENQADSKKTDSENVGDTASTASKSKAEDTGNIADTAKTADTAEEASDAAKASKGTNVAGFVGGQIGRSAAEGGAEALGADKQTQDIAGEAGEYGGEAGGTALYNKHMASKRAADSGAQSTELGAGTGGAGTTGTVGSTGATAGTGSVGSTVATGGAAAGGAAGSAAGSAGAGTVAGTTGGAATAGGAAAGGTAAGGAAATTVSWPVVLIVLAIILLIIIIMIVVAIVAPKLSFDKNDPINQQTVASIQSYISSDKIVFANGSSDMQKIEKGEMGKPALDTINNLAKLHEQIHVHYTGTREYAPGQVGVNDSFEFDIIAVDKIKCTNTSSNTKAIEFPIYLNLNYNWQSLVLPNYSDKIVCAVGYYPNINSPVSTTYKDQFSPGEFPIQQLPARAKMAAQEKTAQLIDEIVSQDRLLGIDSNSHESLLPAKITLDQTMLEKNIKRSNTEGLNSVLAEKIKQAYSTTDSDLSHTLLEPIKNYNGLHISFL